MVGLPKALEGPLRAEKEVTALQKSVWSEGRGGADLLLEVRFSEKYRGATSSILELYTYRRSWAGGIFALSFVAFSHKNPLLVHLLVCNRKRLFFGSVLQPLSLRR